MSGCCWTRSGKSPSRGFWPQHPPVWSPAPRERGLFYDGGIIGQAGVLVRVGWSLRLTQIFRAESPSQQRHDSMAIRRQGVTR